MYHSISLCYMEQGFSTLALLTFWSNNLLWKLPYACRMSGSIPGLHPMGRIQRIKHLGESLKEIFFWNLIWWHKNLCWRKKRTRITKIIWNKIGKGNYPFLLVVIVVKAVYYWNRQKDQWNMTDKMPRNIHKHRHPNICGIWGEGMKKTHMIFYILKYLIKLVNN